MSDCDTAGSSPHLSSDSHPRKSRSATCFPSSTPRKEGARTSPSPASPQSLPVHMSKVTFPRARSNNLYDKALPPLPDAAGPAPSLNQLLPLNSSNPEVPSHSSLTGFPSAPKIRTFSTSAIALAGFDLGVMPVMPSTSQLPSRVHGVADDDQNGKSPASPVLRKTKSSSKLNQKKSLDRDSSSKASQIDREHRRIRGLSFGSPYLLNFSRDTKGKGKEKDADAGRTVLSRRGSFWSRKRQPAPNSEATTPVSILSSKSFPQLTSPRQPGSPVIRTEPSNQLHRRGLSRSLSERSFLSRPSRSVFDSRRLPRSRPSSAHTPHAANSSSPANSFFKPPWSRESNDLGEKSRVRPRPRAQTNPPLLHRLSFNIFSFTTSPPSPHFDNEPPTILTESPTNSKTKLHTVMSPKHSETPGEYVQRLTSSIGKGEMATILASSTEMFHVESLQIYIDRFNFVNDPLDIAMRKLLMHVGLPRETQQIDRVIEAFGRRYLHCNPGLFIADHPYILAFSLMMLHTDAFNKSNKRKMTKADYVKNTKLPGVPVEVLECFYDNIVFAPFIFIEDPFDIDSGMTPTHDLSSRILSPVASSSLTLNANAGALLKGGKIDPYYLIVNNSLAPLRIDVHLFVPHENPYSYEGTAGPWDIDQLQYDFAGATVLLFNDLNQWQDVADTYFIPHRPEEVDASGCFPHVPISLTTTCGLKIIKVGLLSKKEDISVGSKKATNRKWRPWTVVLTTSHLLFFRDLSLVYTLLPYVDSSHRRIKFPPTTNFRPDAWLTISDSIAVHDQLYTKYNNVFRFATSDGRQMLLQAGFEKDMNDWMARINYASTFKTTQIRVRPPSMSGKMVELTGVAAAASHLQDIHHRRRSNHLCDLYTHTPSISSDTLLDDDKPNAHAQHATSLARLDETDIPVAPEVEGADQFKATFDQVKADLAACLLSSFEEPGSSDDSIITRNPATAHITIPTGLPSRFHTTQAKVEDLQKEIAAIQSQLDSDMRVVRNIAQLTPFQKATRDRLETALQSISRRIIESRIKLTKLLCYHDTLCRDLSSEIRSWGEAKKMAFQAAQLTLQKHFDKLMKQPNSITKSSNKHSNDPQRHRLRSTSSSEQSSSACESFHSALDIKIDGELAISNPPDGLGTTSPSGDREVQNPTIPLSSINRNSSSNTPQTSEQEEAEVWDKTRCAQRVSLVRLPSTLQMARLRSLGELYISLAS